jgi:hypothetical protein
LTNNLNFYKLVLYKQGTAMTQKNQTSTSQETYQAWQKYFEEQQKLVLAYWTAVLNSMWSTGK